MKKLAFILNVFLMLVLMGCQEDNFGQSGMSKLQCQNSDWAKLGYKDAFNGNLNNRFKKREQECLKFNISASLENYSTGFELGKLEFCKGQDVFKLGLTGQENIFNECPNSFEGKSEEFKRGYKIFKAKEKLKVTRQEIKNLKKYLVFLNLNKDKYPTLLKKTEEKIQDLEFYESQERSYVINLMLENEVQPNFYNERI